MYLSKTDFIEYLKCPKCLWLKKNRPDLYIKPVLSEFDINLFSEGQEVDIIVRELFPGGLLVCGTTKESAEQTKKLVDQKESPIFQATFTVENTLVAKIDVLVYNKETDRWDIYESKSSTEIKTDRDHNHIKDVTFQRIVAQRTGLTIGESYLIHLNKDYRKKGNINIPELFKIRNISEDVKTVFETTNKEIDEALIFLQNEDINLDSCSCIYLTRSNHCSSFSVFNPQVPDYSVHDIARIHPTKLKSLIDSGIFHINQVSESFILSEIQRTQITLEQQKSVQVNAKKIHEILNGLNKPIYFIDYETFLSAIPKLDGFGPHQHVPFQVSIHIFDVDGELYHREYLADSIEGAVPGVIGLMQEVIQEGGSIVSWHASFENTRNKQVSEIYPEYKDFLDSVIRRTFDLEDVFKKEYVHFGFNGKTSIKKVLPIISPKFSYKDLEIQGGTAAMENWRKMVFDDISDTEKKSIRVDLLKYCKMDTLAMVEIYKHLLQL